MSGDGTTGRLQWRGIDVEVPTVYAHDLQEIVSFIDWISRSDPESDLTIEAGTRIVLWSKNDYPVGTLHFEEGQWRFTPHADWANDPAQSAPSEAADGE